MDEGLVSLLMVLNIHLPIRISLLNVALHNAQHINLLLFFITFRMYLPYGLIDSYLFKATEVRFIFSKSTIENLGKGVKYVQS